ncbi:DUF6572 domain-containing protein [Cellulomonas humilata]|uniref:Uncharacterized protein n=1 Tax=Cellulomonas humilata TaxID=144055 RepID=A0ABU0EDE2_9CELL|nr:DUF6572 domain-containing protein [Cellulomonas humilata]MDQ0372847.1 hypothetical protein [Cellulomonas humilata]
MRFGRRQPEALFDPAQIDVVAESSDGVIELVVVQANRWTGSDAQLESLQAKVQTYVSFALDGELLQRFPDAAGKPWRIVVNSLDGDPDSRTRQVLEVVATRLPDHGGSLLLRSP